MPTHAADAQGDNGLATPEDRATRVLDRDDEAGHRKERKCRVPEVRLEVRILQDISRGPGTQLERYTQLPTATSPRIAELAEEWTATTATAVDAALVLQNRLRREYGYSLDQEASVFADPVLAFLEEGNHPVALLPGKNKRFWICQALFSLCTVLQALFFPAKERPIGFLTCLKLEMWAPCGKWA